MVGDCGWWGGVGCVDDLGRGYFLVDTRSNAVMSRCAASRSAAGSCLWSCSTVELPGREGVAVVAGRPCQKSTHGNHNACRGRRAVSSWMSEPVSRRQGCSLFAAWLLPPQPPLAVVAGFNVSQLLYGYAGALTGICRRACGDIAHEKETKGNPLVFIGEELTRPGDGARRTINHFESPRGQGRERRYVLHYRDCSALVRVVAVAGERSADEFSSGEDDAGRCGWRIHPDAAGGTVRVRIGETTSFPLLR